MFKIKIKILQFITSMLIAKFITTIAGASEHQYNILHGRDEDVQTRSHLHIS